MGLETWIVQPKDSLILSLYLSLAQIYLMSEIFLDFRVGILSFSVAPAVVQVLYFYHLLLYTRFAEVNSEFPDGCSTPESIVSIWI